MADSGIRLQLFLGPTRPTPAPFEVVDALLDLQVTDNDRERDGFQARFSIGKSTPMDYGLLQRGYFDPPSRFSVMVIYGGSPQMLINGVITNHQVIPSNKPGQSTLVVTGEDISLLLDLEEKTQTHPSQSDSTIARNLLTAYMGEGIVPDVTQTDDTPLVVERVPNQQKTDLVFLRDLAQRNGFVFYADPQVPGTTMAYWGPEKRLGKPQPTLSMNMGPITNVDSPITFSFNALGPSAPQVVIAAPDNGLALDVGTPTLSRPPLASRPAPALRKTRPRDTANLSATDAQRRALAGTTQTADAVTATGEVDAIRYGQPLLSAQLVGVRGVGDDYDGVYYVQQVTHRIKRGEYKQSFRLTREGRGALTPVLK